MFAHPEVVVDTTPFTRQNAFLENAVNRLNTVVLREVLPDVQARMDQSINADAGQHKRPTDWQTPKQRRWWYAVGIYLWQGRTGKVRTWKALFRPSEDGGQIVAVNPTDYWRYVFGTPQVLQQRMHMGTWTALPTYLSAERAVLIPEVEGAFLTLQEEFTP